MRLTARNARKDRGGKHNDRNYDISKSDHIDASKSAENKYYTYNGDTESTFEELEKQFYQENFMSHIEKQNKRNIEARHPERNMTLDRYYRHDHSRPEDQILQIGDIHEHASAEELWDCALEYATKFNDRFGDHCKILDMALHVDEATPHVHIRRVWIGKDKNGDACVSQTTALRNMGFQKNNSNKWVNEKKEFTKLDRQLFYNICKEHGLKVEIDNPINREHLSIPEYKKAMRELDTMREKKESLKEEVEQQYQKANELAERILQVILSNQYIADKHYRELEKAKEKDALEKLRIFSEIYSQEIESLYSYAAAKEFIREEGMQAKYTAYCKRKKLLQEKQNRQGI